MKKKFLLLFCISYITSVSEHIKNTNSKPPKNLQLKNGAKPLKNSNYEFSVKNLFQKMSKKLSKISNKKNRKNKQKLKKHEITLLKNLYKTLKLEKTLSLKKPSYKQKQRKLKIPEIQKKWQNLLTKTLPLQPKKNRKLFADTISEFGLTQVTSFFSVFVGKVEDLMQNPMEVINSAIFILFIIGIFRRFKLRKEFRVSKRSLEMKNGMLSNMKDVIDKGREDLMEAKMGVERMKKKVDNLNKLFRFRIDNKIKMLYKFADY